MSYGSSGVDCLAAILRFYGIATDSASLLQRAGLTVERVNQDNLVRCARQYGLKSRLIGNRTSEQLAAVPLPAIAARLDASGFFILLRIVGGRPLILESTAQRPELLTREAFEEIWDGSLILITKRASLSTLGDKFNLSWFLGAVHKYRQLLGEVLIASFMLNIFGVSLRRRPPPRIWRFV